MRRKLSTSKAPHSPGDKPRRRKCGLKRRELAILQAVASLDVATAEDIRLLLDLRSRPHLGELLKYLSGGEGKKNAYIYQFSMPNTSGHVRFLYTLTRRGRKVLEDQGREVTSWYRPEEASRLSFSLLHHDLAVAKVQVGLRLFVRRYKEYTLLETRTWLAMAESPPRFTRPTVGGDSTITVIPDLFVSLQRTHKDPSKKQGFGLWFEVDRGTESKAKFQQLVLNRIDLIRQKAYENYFGISYILLVYLAVGGTTEYRLHRLHMMRKWTMELLRTERLSDWGPVFRFSTIDESLYDSLMLFTDPVCYMPNSDTLVPLFPPSTDKEESDDKTTPGSETPTTP